MPHCPKPRRHSKDTTPWVSLRSRSLSVRLRSRTVKRLSQAPPVKKKPRKKKQKRLPAVDPVEEDSFLYGHAFDVLLALGLVPTQDRLQGLNRMHVMDGDCEKSSEMVAESAPDPELVSAKTTEIKLSKEDLPAAEQEVEPEAPELPESIVKSPPEVKEEKEGAPEPIVNGESKEEKSDSCESEVKVTTADLVEKEKNVCVENGTDEERTKDKSEEKNAKESVKEVNEVKEAGSGGVSEEEDRTSVTSSQSRKRAALVEGEVEGEGSSSESDVGIGKRARLELDDGEDERERLVREYVEECSEGMDDMTKAAEKLQREIGALGELLRSKEMEWNSILRLRKLKEEMLERLLRRRRLSAIMSGRDDSPPDSGPYVKAERGGKANQTNSMPNNTNHVPLNNGGLMMVPIVSSSPSAPHVGHVTSSVAAHRGPLPRPPEPHPRGFRMQRPILPKPGPGHQSVMEQNSVVGEGRSRHPENVPRRGRRMRPHDGPPRHMLEPPVVSSTRISGSPALMSMANMALGSGSHVRENPQGPHFMGQENSRPSSADSSRGQHLDMIPNPSGLSFKDALVQFAKMSQPPAMPSKPPPPPPPYPEVTLHPVPSPHSPPPPPSHQSLLHGILTKNSAPGLPPHAQPHRATTFSPTLARLLTAPERVPAHPPAPPQHFRPPSARVNINEILTTSKKNRNEITITPVSGSNKTKDDVVMLGDDDEEGDGDRLVIDESRTAAAGDNGANSELPENVPECQGCHQRAAQFVCAGCGNQWYCSRECQVSAWEEHSEMCSG